jgi:hypothetical protein
MILYHRTTAAAAADILHDGFRDGVGRYLTSNVWSGVWLSNVPLDSNEGAEGDVLLRVELALDEEDLTRFEWVEEGKYYREWLIPARLINSHGTVQACDH